MKMIFSAISKMKLIEDKFLLTTVFVSGMSIMGVEMSASRLLAPYFGTSLFVWTNIIGIIMLALSIGYYFGGRIADKYPKKAVFYSLLLGAGIYIGLIPFIAKPIMAFSVTAIDMRSVGLFYASLFTTIVLFCIPLAVLGMMSPYAIRLCAEDVKKMGKTAGSIYSLSTIGSIVGTFIPALLTIPFIGTKNTIILFSFLLALCGIIGLKKVKLAFLSMLLLVFLFLGGNIKSDETVIYEGESIYNYIQVRNISGTNHLMLNEGHASHSLYNPDKVMSGGVWSYFLMLPKMKKDVKDVLIVGIAGGTISKEYLHYYPDMKIDGVEIDPEIIEVGRNYFDMNERNLAVYNYDGRVFLKTTDKKYDLIIIDAYKQPYIPFHLTTAEFFSDVKAHLNEGGIVAINVGTTSEDSEILFMVSNTLSSLFNNTYLYAIPNYFNYILYSSDLDYSPLLLKDLEDEDFREMAENTVKGAKKVVHQPDDIILTDDKAPVEVFTDKMIYEYAAGYGG